MPISADPIKAREKADLIKAKLSREGNEVVSPFDVYAGKEPTYEDYICYDLRAMLDCDAILFCKGWEKSCGCRTEHATALIFKEFERKDFKMMYE
ncbi:MAG: DUF4406 domain-containing protein [Muribaculaceae bacterium]|nr:DUF4406 domain-containing protein [Muribaculaceae bacterium]